MGTLADKLAQAGLVTEEQAQSVTAKERAAQTHQRTYRRLKGASYGLAQLETEESVVQFREQAKALLIGDHTLLDDVLRIARAFGGPDQEKERKNLVWRLYKVRDGFRGCRSADERETVVRRMLSRTARPPKTETRKKGKGRR